MKLKKLCNGILIGLILGGSSTLYAKEGWYAGFAIGQNSIDADTPRLDVIPQFTPGIVAGDISNLSFHGFDSDKHFGFVFNGGYRLNANVALNVDATATYADINVDYTTPSSNHSSDLDVVSYHLTPGVNLIYPINSKFDIYLKLGISLILTDIERTESFQQAIPNPPPANEYTESIKDWDIAPTVGVGAEWGFGQNWAATFEYTITEYTLQPISNSDVSYNGIGFESQNILLGLRYNFN